MTPMPDRYAWPERYRTPERYRWPTAYAYPVDYTGHGTDSNPPVQGFGIDPFGTSSFGGGT